MSKCSVLSTCQSNLWYSTLLRPKYWAEAPPARQASRAAAAASRIAVRGKKDERDIEPPFDRSTFLKPRIVFKSGAFAPLVLSSRAAMLASPAEYSYVRREC